MSHTQLSFIIQVVINLLLIVMILLTDYEIKKFKTDTAVKFASFLDMYQKLKLTQEETNKAYDRLIDIYRGQTTMYTNIYEQNIKMIEGYNMMVDQHGKLLECWDGVEKRYSQSYEQFMHVNKQLIELNPILKQIVKEGMIFRTDVDMVRRVPIAGNHLTFNTGPEIPDKDPESEEPKPKKKTQKSTKKKEAPSGEDEKVSAA